MKRLVPSGTPYQYTNTANLTLSPKSPLLISKDHGSTPATSQTINHDVDRHSLSSYTRQETSKFMSRRDSPYVILSQPSPTAFEVASLEDPDVPIRVYHTSSVRPHQDLLSKPLTPFRKRGRPRKTLPGSSPRWCQGQKGRLQQTVFITLSVRATVTVKIML
ncbi:uncharacterized protein TNIN_437201 [Trichonephila inaurata madagascariensis]|uniref:Uncharacterized protein n=1 Tax=Trichonephila inaurata madagascariensis TaxID=2747483 RepID=A0A8X7BYW0_9ARAC|nr:uncharacterized protein TNIN_437201 [Trichonephila inaurata madagascariensis]